MIADQWQPDITMFVELLDQSFPGVTIQVELFKRPTLVYNDSEVY